MDPTQPIEYEDGCNSQPMFDDLEWPEPIDIDSDQEELPEEPDLEWYLDHYELDDDHKVSLCRAYASYLVAKGTTGRSRPGPPRGMKREK